MEARRYDIDWLRVIAIGLLLIYHIAISFQPWGIWIKFIQNIDPWEGLWKPMTMLNVWRIPLLFFVSGMGVAFAMRKRNLKDLLIERTRRILIPLIFGALAIVPLHDLIWQVYYGKELSFYLTQGHLWFLGNIFVYVLVLSPFFYLLKRGENNPVRKFIVKLFSHPLSFVVVALSLMAETLLVKPFTYEMYAMTLHGFWIGFVAFFWGFCFVLSGEGFEKMIMKWKWAFLLVALGMYVFRYTQYNLMAPHPYLGVETTAWIFALLGFARSFLNRPSNALSYMSKAAYPVYILHMLFLYIASYFVLPLALTAVAKFIIITVFTFIMCWVAYEFLIKRVNVLRFLFGLNLMKKEEKPAVGQVSATAA